MEKTACVCTLFRPFPFFFPFVFDCLRETYIARPAPAPQHREGANDRNLRHACPIAHSVSFAALALMRAGEAKSLLGAKVCSHSCCST